MQLMAGALLLVMISCISCGKKQADPGEERGAETTEVTGALGEADIKDSELTGIEAVVAYAESMLGAENYVAYWDSAENRGTVLENGQEILPKAGDYFIVGGSDFHGFSTAPNLAPEADYSDGNHAIIFITEEWTDASEQWVAIYDSSDHRIEYNITNETIEVVGEIRNIEEDGNNGLTGIEAVVAYAKSMDDAENYVAYWDSTSNQASILENGQQFSPKVGDYIIIGGSTIKGFHTMPNLECDIDNTERNHFIIPITEEYANSDHLGVGFWDNDDNYTEYEFTLAKADNNENTSTHYYEFLESTDRTEACVVVTDEDFMIKDVFLEDGDSYTLAENEFLTLYLPKEATSSSTTSKDAEIYDYGALYVSHGTNMKIPISIEYADGTTEELTIYVTRE